MSTSLQHMDDESAVETRAAWTRLSRIVIVFCLVALLPYAHPSLLRLRPWVSGEGMPIIRMFQRMQALPTFAEASRGSGAVERGLDTGLSEAVIASSR